MKRINILLLLLFPLLLLSSCKGFKSWVAQEFMADKVSDGVARLSAQHMSMIVSELNAKFDEAEAVIVPATDPAQYGKGTVSWTLNNIDIDHPNETAVHTDCNGDQGLWQGKVSISKASRTMFGRLTGNPAKPVIPEPGTLKIKVTAQAQDLAIRFPSKDGHLKLHKGHMKFTAWPRLAQNESGMRLAPTPNTRFEGVKFTDVSGTLVSNDVEVPVRISDSRLSVQVGAGEGGRENVLTGTLTMAGYARQVPTDGAGLDPTYDAQRFLSSYACRIKIQGQISYQHVPIENKVAPGVAALSSALMASLATEVDENSDCGMNSAGVVQESILTGVPGAEGEFKSTLSKNCVIEFSGHQTTPNCFGQAKIIDGTIIVTKAQKTVSGLVIATQEDLQAQVKDYVAELTQAKGLGAATKRPKVVLPSTNRPVTFALSLKLDNITFKDICTNHGNTRHPRHCQNRAKGQEAEQIIFKVASGEVAAEIRPLTGQNMDPNSAGAFLCATKTPMGEASVDIKTLHAAIDRGGLTINAAASGHYSLVRGFIGERENQLKGSLKIGEELFEFKSPSQDYLDLDPSYDRTAFLDSFLSCQALSLTTHAQACRPEAGLGANMARLLVLNAGSLLKIAASKDVPQSFASKFALDNSQLSEEDKLLMMPTLLPQAIDLASPALSSAALMLDSQDNETRLSGQVLSMSGTMLRHGQRLNQPVNVLGININFLSYRWIEGLSTLIQDKKEVIIRPLTPTSTSISLVAQVKDFATIRYKAHRETPEPSLNIQEALFDIKATPLFAIDARTVGDEQPSYSIATPVVKFDEITIERAPVIFKGSNITIPFYIEHAKLRAHNGRYQGQGNYLEGTMGFSITNDPSQVAASLIKTVTIHEQALVPDFDQEAFDASYADTEYLHEVLSAE